MTGRKRGTKQFESSVNSEGIETRQIDFVQEYMFESSVNSEGIETCTIWKHSRYWFESSVNSEGIETSGQSKC